MAQIFDERKYRIVGFICEVLICTNFARNHELANYFYVAVMQFANFKLANITADYKIDDKIFCYIVLIMWIKFGNGCSI